MLIVILKIQVKFKLNITAVSICDYLLGTVPKNKMIRFCFSDFEVGSCCVRVAVTVEEICMYG